MIRRLRSLLAAATLALCLLAPPFAAFAQAPGPVPALPDAERRTSYSITASTCNCSVGFQLFGDGNDVANWLTVWVNGVQIPQAGNWSITSPSGSLATLPRPITDAVLTFITAQTGTVEIVGARRPRRTSQFSENRGVAARDMNQVLSDLEAQVRELWDRQTRTVQAPPGDTLNILPALSGRASMNACFDSGGNLTSCVGASSGSFAAGTGILFSGTNPTTITNNMQAGSGILITGTNPLTISATAGASALYVRPQDFGAACDGVTNDAAALQNMITASAGKTIYIPPGPDCLTSASLSLPSNTTITGGGREVSTIRSTTANPVFTSLNASNISLSHFWCKGSDAVVSWTASSFGCFRFQQNASAVAAGSNYNIQNMKFSGFNATYWNYFDSVGSTQLLRNITFSNHYILTATADIPTDPTISNNSNFGLVIYSGSAGNGQVQNTIVKNNRLEAAAMCFPVVLFSNHYKFQINDNLVLSPGATSSTHCTASNGPINAYGIMVYDVNGDGNPPLEGIISTNTIINPYASGIYLVGDGNTAHNTPVYNSSQTIIANNFCEAQFSDDDSLLPRGCIVVNGLTDVDVIGNRAYAGFGGFAATGQMTGTVRFQGNTCQATRSDSTKTVSCLRLDTFGNGPNARYIVKGENYQLMATTDGAAIRTNSAAGRPFANLEISDTSISAGWVGINLSGQFSSGPLVLKNIKFDGVANSAMLSMAGLTGTATLQGLVFDSSAGVAGTAADLHGSTFNANGLLFTNRASGTVAMYRADGSCGTLRNVQFNNVVQAAQVFGGSLGLSNPSSCTLNYLDQVQNLTPSAAGAAGSQYIVDHWSHISTSPSTTHVDQRMLTGT